MLNADFKLVGMLNKRKGFERFLITVFTLFWEIFLPLFTFSWHINLGFEKDFIIIANLHFSFNECFSKRLNKA